MILFDVEKSLFPDIQPIPILQLKYTTYLSKYLRPLSFPYSTAWVDLIFRKTVIGLFSAHVSSKGFQVVGG